MGNHAFYASSIQGGAQYHAGYVIPIRKGTTFVSHYRVEPEAGSTAVLGLRQKSDIVDITATVNSKGRFATILNFKNQVVSLKLCAEADYSRDHYAFGYGVSVGPQQ